MLDCLIQMAPDSRITIAFDKSGRLTFHLLHLWDSVTESVSYIDDILNTVEQKKVWLEILQNVRLIIKVVNVVEH